MEEWNVKSPKHNLECIRCTKMKNKIVRFGYIAYLRIFLKKLLTFVLCRVYINKAVANDNNKQETT